MGGRGITVVQVTSASQSPAKRKNVISYNLRNREETTTDTEEAAIAADAIQGFRDSPHFTKTPRTKTQTSTVKSG